MRPILFALLCMLPTFACATAPKPPEDPLPRVAAFLKEQFPGKTWQAGPIELTSESLRAAYPDRRFFAVMSVEPLPPGAAPPPDQRPTWGEIVEEFRATHVTAVVAMNAKGELALHRDLNDGLKRVKDERDAKAVCTAVLSLTAGTRSPPQVESPDDMTATRTEDGWDCSLQRLYLMGNATITREGRVENVSKTSTAPMPPSAPPMRR